MKSVRLMLRGVECGPWPLQTRLTMNGFRFAMQLKERDPVLGHIAVIDLLGFDDRDMLQALTDPGSGASDALVLFLRYALGQVFQAHLLICPEGADDVAETKQLTVGALKAALGSLIASESVLVLVLPEPRPGAVPSRRS